MSHLILIRTNVRIKYTQYAKLCWLLLWHCKLQALRSSYSGNLSPNILGRLILQEEVPPTHFSEAIHFGHTKPDALKGLYLKIMKYEHPVLFWDFYYCLFFLSTKKSKQTKNPSSSRHCSLHYQLCKFQWTLDQALWWKNTSLIQKERLQSNFL